METFYSLLNILATVNLIFLALSVFVHYFGVKQWTNSGEETKELMIDYMVAKENCTVDVAREALEKHHTRSWVQAIHQDGYINVYYRYPLHWIRGFLFGVDG